MKWKCVYHLIREVLSNIQFLARYRGNSIGLEAAEAFEIVRCLNCKARRLQNAKNNLDIDLEILFEFIMDKSIQH